MGAAPGAGTTRLPRAVWIDSTGMWNHNAGLPPSLGMLEWRRGPDARGGPGWEGLVIWANSHREGTWSSGCTWIRSACIRPMEMSDWRC